MGAFYVNYTLKGTHQSAVMRALATRKALVSRSYNEAVVVFDQESDSQDQRQIASLALQLSRSLCCTVLAALVHDSDVFWYRLYQNGKFIDEYNSTPGYWSPSSDEQPPAGGDALQLCAAFGVGDVDSVERILRSSWQTYVFAEDRHADLVRALHLPDIAVGYGFEGISRGQLPEGVSIEDISASSRS